jgi:hypothetical protein
VYLMSSAVKPVGEKVKSNHCLRIRVAIFYLLSNSFLSSVADTIFIVPTSIP